MLSGWGEQGLLLLLALLANTLSALAGGGFDLLYFTEAEAVPAALAKGSPTERPAPGPARFAVGDAVCTRAGHVDHHSRLPGYVQGKRGTITRLHGAHVFADANARGLGEQPQWLYTVVFDGAMANAKVSLNGALLAGAFLDPAQPLGPPAAGLLLRLFVPGARVVA